jgi:hypothetical protein
MVVGLITDDDQTAFREKIRDLAVWCQDNNKTKELIVDYRKSRAEHAPIHIDGAVVGRELQVPWCPHQQIILVAGSLVVRSLGQ